MIGWPSLLVAAFLNLKQPQMTFKYALYRVSSSYSLRLAIDDEAEKAVPNFSNSLKGAARKKFSWGSSHKSMFFLNCNGLSNFLSHFVLYIQSVTSIIDY